MNGSLLKAFIFFFAFNKILVPEEGWGLYTGKSGNFSKSLLTLGLQLNQISFKASEKTNRNSILVCFSSITSDNLYFKTLHKNLGDTVSILEYKTETPIVSDIQLYDARRIQYFLKEGKLFNSWPPIYPEIREVQRELENGDFKKKYLLLSGNETILLLHSNIQKDFDGIIMVTPDVRILELEPDALQKKNLLWIGNLSIKARVNSLKEKFSGEMFIYERSSSGRNMLLQNLVVLEDIRRWLQDR